MKIRFNYLYGLRIPGNIIVLLLIYLGLGNAHATTCQKPTLPTLSFDTYYAPAQGKEGSDLRSALHRIIKGHRAYSYGCVWDILREADEDHSSCSGSGQCSHVIGIYTGRSIIKSRRDRGRDDPDSWNREHVWSKSHGFRSRSQHAFTDAHHLRAADKSVNGDRGSLDFDEGGSRHEECHGCRYDGDSWEPPDTVKGDIARMMFYMAVRYEGDDGGNTPDLELVDQNTGSGQPRFGHLCTLLKWHRLDRVSETEKRWNDIIYSWQENRNPFIDHPEWVDSIWRFSGCSGLPTDTTPPQPIALTIPPAPTQPISIVTWNVREGFSVSSISSRRSQFRAAGKALQPDILLLQEVTSQEVAEAIRDAMGLTDYHVATSDFNQDDHNRYASFEVAIISRYPLSQVIELDPSPDNRSADEPQEQALSTNLITGISATDIGRGYLTARVEEYKLDLSVVHLKSSRGRNGSQDARNALKREFVMAAIAERIADDRDAHPEFTYLVAGDFNVGHSDTKKNGTDLTVDCLRRRCSGRDRYDETHALLGHGLVEGLFMTNLTGSIPDSTYPRFPGSPIDNIYVTGHLTDHFQDAEKGSDTHGSDHLPVRVVLEAE